MQPFEDSFKRAFALKPNQLFFLTDGAFDPKLIQRVKDRNRNAGNKVHVNTIAYGGSKDDDGTEKAVYRDQFKQIATENGGEF